MKFIKRLISGLIFLIVLISLVIVGGSIYVRKTYNIDLYQTVKHLKKLSEPVVEEEMCPYAFSDEDMVDVQTEVNKSVENFITFNEEQGFKINFGFLPDTMKYMIKLTDKQVGSLAQTIIEQEYGGKIEVGGKEINLALKQVEFSNIVNGDATFNAVVQIDTTIIKNEMESFPFTYLKKYVPDYFYISSTIQVNKLENPFTYEVEHVGLMINQLDATETEDLFITLDLLFNIGTAKDLNEQIGNIFLSALIGNETNTGLAYSLKEYGAKDYTFLEEDGIGYFAIQRGLVL